MRILATASIHFGGFKFAGDFTAINLIAASTNALNGALLARRPDHYKNFTVVGVLLMALLMGLGGGMTRDVLLAHVPAALTNPAYLTLTLVVRGRRIAYRRGLGAALLADGAGRRTQHLVADRYLIRGRIHAARNRPVPGLGGAAGRGACWGISARRWPAAAR